MIFQLQYKNSNGRGGRQEEGKECGRGRKEKDKEEKIRNTHLHVHTHTQGFIQGGGDLPPLKRSSPLPQVSNTCELHT